MFAMMVQRAFVPQPTHARIFAASQRGFATVAAHSRMPVEKDYYKILDISSDATPEQVKDAYRTAAKKHHPDVVGSTQPDAQKFRDVLEAYGVLSVTASRANYDLLRAKNPDRYREISEVEFKKTYAPGERDASGNVARAAPAAGSYAEERLAELKEQRKQYNVNHLGYYQGGLPQKGRGAIRGTALGVPGRFHQPKFHNYQNFYHPDNKTVNQEDAVKFKAFMQADKDDFLRTKPGHPMYYDTKFEFMADRTYWLFLALGVLTVYYGLLKMPVEIDRMRRWEREGSIEDLPGHHFNNRGGVLVKKQFAGFEKYHKNIDEMMAWYSKAYPASQ